MKLKDKILVTLLLTLGLLLHYISPGIFFGMKMDFLLIFMIVSIILYPKMESCILVGILGGIFSALTTSLPGGQIPNFIDKFISTYIIYLLVILLKNKLDKLFYVGLIGFIGTMVSGTIFLISAKYILLAEDIAFTLIYLVVLPTAIINSIGTVFIYKLTINSLYKLTY